MKHSVIVAGIPLCRKSCAQGQKRNRDSANSVVRTEHGIMTDEQPQAILCQPGNIEKPLNPAPILLWRYFPGARAMRFCAELRESDIPISRGPRVGP